MKSITIEIDLLKNGVPLDSSHHQKSSLSESKNEHKKYKVQLSDFLPSTIGELVYMKTSLDFENGDNNIGVDNPRAHWGEGGGQFGRIKDYRQIKMAAEKIESLMEYPPFLAYKRVGGVIRARMVIDENGGCNWTDSYIDGTNPLLRFYVLRSLKSFCRIPLWHGQRIKKSSNIDFSFDFNIYSKESPETKILGNLIMMHLPGKQDRGSWRLGPLQGHFAFPTFILLNPNWIVENWNKLIQEEEPIESIHPEENSKLGFSQAGQLNKNPI